MPTPPTVLKLLVMPMEVPKALKDLKALKDTDKLPNTLMPNKPVDVTTTLLLFSLPLNKPPLVLPKLVANSALVVPTVVLKDHKDLKDPKPPETNTELPKLADTTKLPKPVVPKVLKPLNQPTPTLHTTEDSPVMAVSLVMVMGMGMVASEDSDMLVVLVSDMLVLAWDMLVSDTDTVLVSDSDTVLVLEPDTLPVELVPLTVVLLLATLVMLVMVDSSVDSVASDTDSQDTDTKAGTLVVQASDTANSSVSTKQFLKYLRSSAQKSLSMGSNDPRTLQLRTIFYSLSSSLTFFTSNAMDQIKRHFYKFQTHFFRFFFI